MGARNRGLGAAFALGAGLAASGFLVGRSRAPRPRVIHLRLWRRMLIARRGAAEGAALAERVRARYADLYSRRPRFEERALRAHLAGNILPALALYQVLQEVHDNREAAMAETQALVEATIASHRRLVLLLGRVPGALVFPIVRWLMREGLRLGFPVKGWEIELREDSGRRFAFDIHRCFYLDVLSRYGAPELTALFCRLDDLVYGALPPSVRFERTTTLARGGERCDFCWEARPLPGFNARPPSNRPPSAAG